MTVDPLSNNHRFRDRNFQKVTISVLLYFLCTTVIIIVPISTFGFWFPDLLPLYIMFMYPLVFFFVLGAMGKLSCILFYHTNKIRSIALFTKRINFTQTVIDFIVFSFMVEGNFKTPLPADDSISTNTNNNTILPDDKEGELMSTESLLLALFLLDLFATNQYVKLFPFLKSDDEQQKISAVGDSSPEAVENAENVEKKAPVFSIA